jgi:hypothetical protein
MGIATDIGTRTAISDAAASSAARSGNEQMLGYGIGMAGAAASSINWGGSSLYGPSAGGAPLTTGDPTGLTGVEQNMNYPSGAGALNYGISNFSSVPMGPPNAGSGLSYR